METYFLDETRKTRMMPQNGVKQYLYPLRFSHNAIWDSVAGPDGRFYYALATEIATAGYVRLYAYDYTTNTAEELFRVEDVILPTDRSIRASKFHSSLSFLEDGRMLMTTHTTDKSPRHPTWMPYAYYHHLWEGFAGGQILLYDPKTRHAESLGTPVPHESIYGAAYDAKHNALFFLGMMRGRLYRYALDEKRVSDLGKVTENYSFRLVMANDGNLYGSSRSGFLFKVDTETLDVIDMDFQFEHAPMDFHGVFNMLSIARNGPDGRLYMVSMYTRSIYALDPFTGRIEDMGWYLPTSRYSPDENRHGVFGMDFDSDGVLWYAVVSLNNYTETPEYGIPASLFCWDITRGGKPEWCGILGTPERGGAWISEVSISKDGVLFAANSNHSLDGPGIIGIDLAEFKQHLGDAVRETLTDRYFDRFDPDYVQSANEIHAQESILAKNPTAAPLAPKGSVLLWRALAPQNVPDSAVKGLLFLDDGTLAGVCGETEPKFYFTIKGGALDTLVPIEEVDASLVQRILASRSATLPDGVSLPAVPGRRYKAVADCAADLSGGRKLVATVDGMLAILNGDQVYALGPAAVNGPVHAMASTPDLKRVYGVAGDEDDIASLFTYSDQDGLHWLGFVERMHADSINNMFLCTVVHTIAISPDGSTLAVGADERIGTVVLYDLQKGDGVS